MTYAGKETIRMRKNDERKETVEDKNGNGRLAFWKFAGGRGGGTLYNYTVQVDGGGAVTPFFVEVTDHTGFELNKELKLAGKSTDWHNLMDRLAQIDEFAERIGRFSEVTFMELQSTKGTIFSPRSPQMVAFWDQLSEDKVSELQRHFAGLYFELTASYRLNSMDYLEKRDSGKMYNDSLKFEPESMPRKFYNRFSANEFEEGQ
jgi:hypothetical protein